MKENRINIGLFVCHLENEFSAAVSNGAMVASKKYDTNLIIFPGRYINGVYNDSIRTEFEYQYNTIFNYASSSNLDVLLVVTGTIGGFITKAQMKEILDSYGNLPIITLASEIDTYPCIKFNNKTGLRDGINHLISHGAKKIAFVSGPRTNEDAQERLQTYIDTLAENGIEYNKKLVGYGDFSEYSYNTVMTLLKNNKDNLDAIVFANDKMAIGGYRAIADSGLNVGEDIAVIGFDDSPVALTVSPNLTTVRADAFSMGFRAVEEALNLLETGKIKDGIIDTTLVVRNSCGCKTFKTDEENILHGIGNISEMSDSDAIDAVMKYIFNNENFGADIADAKTAVYDYLNFLVEAGSHKKFTVDFENELSDKFMSVINSNFLTYVSFDKFSNAIDAIYFKIFNSLSEEDKSKFNSTFNQMYKILTSVSISERDNYKDTVRNIAWMTSSICRDILAYANDDQNKYGDIVDKLIRLNVISSYLYTFEAPFAFNKTDKWKTPEYVLLKAYHNNKRMTVLPPEKQRVDTMKLFNNKYTPHDRRFSMIVSPLISQADHFGLLLTELDYENFCFVSAITVQICAALKIISLLNDLEIAQQQLEESLNEIKSNNIILNKISRSDELTGIYNRRGFFETAKSVLAHPQNEGKHAVLVFADMDGLKTINDMFGHDEGDYSLRKIAYILTESFRSTDIVGRIGGDEFSAFAIVNNDNFSSTIKERIREVSDSVNNTSGKPYYINMSVGVVDFTCNPSLDFQSLLDQADNLLYKEKKNKNKIIIREK